MPRGGGLWRQHRGELRFAKSRQPFMRLSVHRGATDYLSAFDRSP
jgi:hypothetical protein